LSGRRPPTRLVLLGSPVAHSLSPTFQNAALVRAGLSVRYEAVDVAAGALDDVLTSLVAAGAAGNVTVPHKARVFAACARRSALAERVGAVNTFWVDDGQLVGDNTDVGGFAHAVRELRGGTVSTWPRRVALLGAGGSAAAVLAAATEWPGATVAVAGREVGRVVALCERFPMTAEVAPTVGDALTGADLVVNATPVGLDGVSMPVEPARLPAGADVLDLVYRRGETAWVRAARARGHRAADGLAMLVEQGALAFERWFGIAPDRAAMWASVR
jgi:shikimate dehydrogenase